MQSTDAFTPSTTEPVFGSGLVSQGKGQLSTNNDANDSEKINSSSEPIVNGQNDKAVSNDNITNGTSENADASDSSVAHVNGQNEKSTNDEVQSAAIEKSNEVEPMVTETPSQGEPTGPVLSTSTDAVKEASSSEPSSTVEPPASTTTTSLNDNALETPIAIASEAVESKTKSPRGKAKAPAIATPTPTPTRQSSRGRKTASSSSTTAEENATTDDTDAAITTTTTNQTESSKPSKRQAATIAKDAITASNQPNSTSGSSMADDGNDHDAIPSDGDDDDDITFGKGKKASAAGRKKRGASTSTANSTKKSRGKNSLTSKGDGDSGAGTSESDTVQSPPKKARTSATKKTPEPPTEEYTRKLRPRK